MSSVDDWLAALDPSRRDEAAWLADVVRQAAPDVESAVKWGRLTFTLDGDWHHWLCAVAATKKQASLTFHKGVLLADPGGLLEGTGRYVRQVPYETAVGQADAVDALVRDAVAHRTDMLPP